MSKSANKSNQTTALATVFLFLVIGQLLLVSVTAAPVMDEEYFQRLLELIKQEGAPSRPSSLFVHQMERKGGRSPTLRLRFGRRSDPLWSKMMPSSSSQADEDIAEKAPY